MTIHKVSVQSKKIDNIESLAESGKSGTNCVKCRLGTYVLSSTTSHMNRHLEPKLLVCYLNVTGSAAGGRL